MYTRMLLTVVTVAAFHSSYTLKWYIYSTAVIYISVFVWMCSCFEVRTIVRYRTVSHLSPDAPSIVASPPSTSTPVGYSNGAGRLPSKFHWLCRGGHVKLTCHWTSRCFSSRATGLAVRILCRAVVNIMYSVANRTRRYGGGNRREASAILASKVARTGCDATR